MRQKRVALELSTGTKVDNRSFGSHRMVELVLFSFDVGGATLVIVNK